MTTRNLPSDEAAKQAASFVPVQTENGWRVLDTVADRFRGQAFRYEAEAARRARHLERIYAT